MIILRMEDAEGQGPFQGKNAQTNGYFGVASYLKYTNDCRDYPTPYEDGIGYASGLHGCQTFDLLLHWFTPALDKLKERGYGIAEYDCDDLAVCVGRRQVVFKKERAKKLCWIPLTEMLS